MSSCRTGREHGGHLTVYLGTMIALAALLFSLAALPEAIDTRASLHSSANTRMQPRLLPVKAPIEVADEFRALYERARFEDAAVLAQRIVTFLAADTDGQSDLPNAYNNLGAAQFQAGHLAAAEASYRISLELLEATESISSDRQVSPLAGMAAVFAAQDLHESALSFLAQALAINRRAGGLFNLEQLPLIEQAASSLLALNDLRGVTRERQYALRIAQQNYGPNDERTLPALRQLAELYELQSEYVLARDLYVRALQIAARERGEFNPLMVESQVAIARTYRLQYTRDPVADEDRIQIRDPVTGDLVGRLNRTTRVPGPYADREGLKLLRSALALLRAVPDPPKRLLATTLTELGDWFQASARPRSALGYYAAASRIYAEDPDLEAENPLQAPRILFYRAPTEAKRYAAFARDGVVSKQADFSFDVTETGAVQNVRLVGGNLPELQVGPLRRTLERAVYSPRFENGRPVRTEGVRHKSIWYELPPPETAQNPPGQP